MGPVSRPRIQLFNNRDNLFNVHRLATGSRLSGLSPSVKRKHVFVAGQFVIVELVNFHKEINISRQPRFRINETAMVNNFIADKGLNLCFHCVFGVDGVFHNDLFLWPGFPRAGVTYFIFSSICLIFFSANFIDSASVLVGYNVKLFIERLAFFQV